MGKKKGGKKKGKKKGKKGGGLREMQLMTPYCKFCEAGMRPGPEDWDEKEENDCWKCASCRASRIIGIAPSTNRISGFEVEKTFTLTCPQYVVYVEDLKREREAAMLAAKAEAKASSPKKGGKKKGSRKEEGTSSKEERKK